MPKYKFFGSVITYNNKNININKLNKDEIKNENKKIIEPKMVKINDIDIKANKEIGMERKPKLEGECFNNAKNFDRIIRKKQGSNFSFSFGQIFSFFKTFSKRIWWRRI